MISFSHFTDLIEIPCVSSVVRKHGLGGYGVIIRIMEILTESCTTTSGPPITLSMTPREWCEHIRTTHSTLKSVLEQASPFVGAHSNDKTGLLSIFVPFLSDYLAGSQPKEQHEETMENSVLACDLLDKDLKEKTKEKKITREEKEYKGGEKGNEVTVSPLPPSSGFRKVSVSRFPKPEFKHVSVSRREITPPPRTGKSSGFPSRRGGGAADAASCVHASKPSSSGREKTGKPVFPYVPEPSDLVLITRRIELMHTKRYPTSTYGLKSRKGKIIGTTRSLLNKGIKPMEIMRAFEAYLEDISTKTLRCQHSWERFLGLLPQILFDLRPVSEDATAIATLLAHQIYAVFPQIYPVEKAPIRTWAGEVEVALQAKEVTASDLACIVDWYPSDPWWKFKILDAKGLLRNYKVLQAAKISNAVSRRVQRGGNYSEPLKTTPNFMGMKVTRSGRVQH